MFNAMSTTIRLHNGIEMPRLGLGTYKSADGPDVEQAVSAAIELGYRSIDTASMYGNEESIGRAIASSGLHRSDIFLTSKVWNDEQGYAETLAAFGRTVKRLNTSYLDLYLVHWPQQATPETWRALEKLLFEGSVRAIGVCNHLPHHLAALMRSAEVRPMVNQYEFHPWLQQPNLLEYCRRYGIVVEAWAPLMRGHAAEEPVLVEIAAAHGKSPSQVALRWLMQLDVVAIPKSIHRDRIAENMALFDFSLSPEEMAAIAAVDRGQRFGPDPDEMAARGV